MEYTKIRENILQIADDDGVYCTLIIGSELAVLFDTGYGKKPLRQFVEDSITTDYIVINSHGHPDHIGGNPHFETIYASPDEFDVIRNIHEKVTGQKPAYQLKPLLEGQVLKLGGISAKTVNLSGHTIGSTGLLIEEERLLIAGDALNPCLWMFTPESASKEALINTLKAVRELPFDSYIFGHGDTPLPRGMVGTILKNVESFVPDPLSRETILGIDTCKSVFADEYGESTVIFPF